MRTMVLCCWILSALSLSAETVFRPAQKTLEAFPKVATSYDGWLSTIDPELLESSYRDGNDIEFWVKALKDDLASLKRAIAGTQETPTLPAVFEVSRLMNEVEKDHASLVSALIGCRSCSSASDQIDTWFRASAPPRVALRELHRAFLADASTVMHLAQARLDKCDER
jgi:hypothetical protein